MAGTTPSLPDPYFIVLVLSCSGVSAQEELRKKPKSTALTTTPAHADPQHQAVAKAREKHT